MDFDPAPCGITISSSISTLSYGAKYALGSVRGSLRLGIILCVRFDDIVLPSFDVVVTTFPVQSIREINPFQWLSCSRSRGTTLDISCVVITFDSQDLHLTRSASLCLAHNVKHEARLTGSARSMQDRG